MPQIASIQPVVPQAQPTGKPSSKEQSQFSPHLDKAISNKKSRQHDTRDKGVKKPSSPRDEEKPSNKEVATDKNGQSLKAGKPENEETPVTATQQDKPEKKSSKKSATTLSPDAAQLLTANSNLPVVQQAETPANSLENASTATANEPNSAGNPLKPAMLQPALSSPLSSKEAPSATPSTSVGKQDTLLSQLQQIIDKANESGSVSIVRAPNASPAASLRSNIHGVETASLQGNQALTGTQADQTPAGETPELNLSGLLTADTDGIDKTARKLTHGMNGVRHDFHQQYFNAKNNTQNLAQNNQNFQDNQNQKGEGLFQQSTNFHLQSGPLGTEQTNTFSHISLNTQNTPSQQPSIPAAPVILPSGAIVHEDDILQQLTNRFQVSGKNTDSRINLKLHPAELGELKIDLTVKEGSIRANVVAQSHHTLEILEKNIPKLRTVLENQGFTVDQISVSADSESVGGFDLSDQQFFSNNHHDYIPIAQNGRKESEAVFSFEDYGNAALPKNTGVNVKI